MLPTKNPGNEKLQEKFHENLPVKINAKWSMINDQ